MITQRIVGWIGVSIVAVLMLAACGGSSDGGASASSDPVNTAVFLSVSANSWEQAQLAGAKAASSELGGGDVQPFDGGFDSKKQIAQIQDATTSGKYKVFVIEPIDAVAAVPALEKAASSGIKVVCLLIPCGSDGSVTNQFAGQAGVVAIDFPGSAKALAEQAIKACEGVDPCKVVYINGDTTFSSDRILVDTVKKSLAGAPNVDLVAAQDGKYDTATSRGVFQNILQRHPDVNVLISWSDQMTLGAEQAAKQAGIADKLKIISNGASEQAVKAVTEGRWYAAGVGQPRTMAKKATEIGIKLARGESVDPTEVKAETLSPVGPFVTKDNASQYTPEWTG